MAEDDANRLRQHAEDALARSFDPLRVLPILHRLAKRAEAGSEDEIFAHLRLAELLVDRSPWRASVHARRVLAHRKDEDRAWAVLALAQTLLGHYKFAQRAYENAIAACPQNPWYAHNLGHLLDIALNNPQAAVPWLERAHSFAPMHIDVAASFAHALARAGQVERARAIIAPFRERDRGKKELAPLLRWLDDGASPTRKAAKPSTPRIPRSATTNTTVSNDASSSATRGAARASQSLAAEHAKTSEGGAEAAPARSRARARVGRSKASLADVLVRGLRHLPLDTRQRARARSLARDATACSRDRRDARVSRTNATSRSADDSHETLEKDGVSALAAAIAYAIVYVDHVPLSAAEVSAPFRVSATRVRAAFEALRAELDITRGDARYATQRRV